jgi:hypothetical protein
MLSKRTTALSVLGLAALATWFKVKKGQNRTDGVRAVQKEDDRLADIIRTARPALERAIQVG